MINKIYLYSLIPAIVGILHLAFGVSYLPERIDSSDIERISGTLQGRVSTGKGPYPGLFIRLKSSNRSYGFIIPFDLITSSGEIKNRAQSGDILKVQYYDSCIGPSLNEDCLLALEIKSGNRIILTKDESLRFHYIEYGRHLKNLSLYFSFFSILTSITLISIFFLFPRQKEDTSN